MPETKASLSEEGGWQGLACLWYIPDAQFPRQLLPSLLLQRPAWDVCEATLLLPGEHLGLGLTWPLADTVTELRREPVGCFSVWVGYRSSGAAGETLLKSLLLFFLRFELCPFKNLI